MPMNRAVTYAHLGSNLRAYFEAVWDEALVPLGGASPSFDNRADFVNSHVLDEHPCTEYRFQGRFGFGGKLRTAPQLQCRVDYYPEDQTDLRDQHLALVNAKLAELWTQYLSKGLAHA